MTAATTVTPGDSQTYDGIFTESAWYEIEFTLDGELLDKSLGTTRFNPAAVVGGSYEYLTGHVYESGEFSWEVRTTDTAGPFDH
ncbi:hypothetical protein [Halorhabdus salina]|uniref:hypothetical protein n=1 Tax=Halorhabdus salina TaxID=2750670 RepID=UPI0015EF1111|nr:hypothetical protein [Halorhabdus salina]